MVGADALRVLITAPGKPYEIVPQRRHPGDLIHQPRLCTVYGPGLVIILLGQGVHLFDHRIKGIPGILFLDQSSGKGRGRSGLPMHHIYLCRAHAQCKGIVPSGLGPSHDIMGRSRSLSQDHAHHRDVRALNGVDQRLAEPQKLCLLSDIAHINAARILEPDERQFVSAAEHDQFIHLDEAFTVEFAPDAQVFPICISGIALA